MKLLLLLLKLLKRYLLITADGPEEDKQNRRSFTGGRLDRHRLAPKHGGVSVYYGRPPAHGSDLAEADRWRDQVNDVTIAVVETPHFGVDSFLAVLVVLQNVVGRLALPISIV